MMKIGSKRLPPPHIKREYERAGGNYIHKDNRWIRVFTEEALKYFYLHDVLLHEIGHHVDKQTQNNKKAEKYAEWFASEYGFKKVEK